MEGYMVALLLAPAPWTRQWSWLLVEGGGEFKSDNFSEE